MDDMTFRKGERITYTDKAGVVYNGVVDSHRRGWVMIHLDEPRDTSQGWKGSKLMLKDSHLKRLSSADLPAG
jgi:hypothetical protein